MQRVWSHLPPYRKPPSVQVILAVLSESWAHVLGGLGRVMGAATSAEKLQETGKRGRAAQHLFHRVNMSFLLREQMPVPAPQSSV